MQRYSPAQLLLCCSTMSRLVWIWKHSLPHGKYLHSSISTVLTIPLRRLLTIYFPCNMVFTLTLCSLPHSHNQPLCMVRIATCLPLFLLRNRLARHLLTLSQVKEVFRALAKTRVSSLEFHVILGQLGGNLSCNASKPGLLS